jgi:hypothetical protein
MKRMAWMTLTLLPVLFTAGAAKAQESSAPVANPVTSTVKAQLTRYAKNMVAAADLMPADKFSFKPTPEMNTFGHLTMHIAFWYGCSGRKTDRCRSKGEAGGGVEGFLRILLDGAGQCGRFETR